MNKIESINEFKIAFYAKVRLEQKLKKKRAELKRFVSNNKEVFERNFVKITFDRRKILSSRD